MYRLYAMSVTQHGISSVLILHCLLYQMLMSGEYTPHIASFVLDRTMAILRINSGE